MHPQQVGRGLMNLICAHSSWVCLLEQQRTKMAEGGQTQAKCELSIIAVFDVRQPEMSSEHLVSLSVLVLV